MLTGKKIILRPLKIEDLETTNKWRNNLELIKLTLGIRFPKTLEMDNDWFDHTLNDKSNRNIYFGIDELKKSEFIGIIQLTNIDWISKTCEFGIVIGNSSITGMGYGKEAMHLLFKYAFNIINLQKITLKVAGFNDKAISIYEKIGFVKEGTLEKHIFFDGIYSDICIYSLFKEQYKPMAQNN